MRCFRRLSGISYIDHITNEEVRNRIRQAVVPYEDLLTLVKRRKLKWYEIIRACQDIPAGHSATARREKKRQTEEEMGGQYPRMDGLEVERYNQEVRKNREDWRMLVARSPVAPQNGPQEYGIEEEEFDLGTEQDLVWVHIGGHSFNQLRETDRKSSLPSAQSKRDSQQFQMGNENNILHEPPACSVETPTDPHIGVHQTHQCKTTPLAPSHCNSAKYNSSSNNSNNIEDQAVIKSPHDNYGATKEYVVPAPEMCPATPDDEVPQAPANPEDPTSDQKDKERKGLWGIPGRKKIVLLLLCAGNCSHMLAFSLLAPFFPREAVKRGVSQTLIGIIFSAFMLVAFLSAPVYGVNLTRIGARFMLVAGLGLGGACTIFMGVLENLPSRLWFIILSFLTRAVQALGMTAYTTASFAVATSEFPEDVAKVYAALATATSIGSMSGPLIGSFLYTVGGFGLPFYLIGSVITLGGVATYKCVPDSFETSPKKEMSDWLLLSRSGLIWTTLLSVTATSFSHGFIDANLALHIEEIGVPTKYVGLMFTVWSVAYAITAPLWGWLSDRLASPFPMLILGNWMCGLSYLLLGAAPFLVFVPSKPWVVLLSLALNSVGAGWTLIPTMKCLILGASNLGYKEQLSTFGVVAGAFQCFFSLGAFSGPTVGGLLIDHTDFDIASTVLGGAFMVVSLVSLLYFCVRRKCI